MNMNTIITHKAFLQDGDVLCETIYDPEQNKKVYLCYNRKTGESWRTDTYELNERTYAPPMDNLAETKAILFPSDIQEYGTLDTLFDCVRDYIHTFLELPDDYLLIATSYVFLSWMYDNFNTLPYLRAKGEFGTGKSRFLSVIGSVCYRACFTSGATSASPIFRLLEAYGGLTILLDEADLSQSGAEVEMIKILNSGYSQGMSVLKTEGDKTRSVFSYKTYGPKLLATRKDFQDLALESRCLTNYMKPMTRTDIPTDLPDSFHTQTEMLRNQLLYFRLRFFGKIHMTTGMRIEGVEPRMNQILMPLLAIAGSSEIKKEIEAFGRKHAQIQRQNRGATLEADILETMVEMVKEKAVLKNKTISQKLNNKRDASEFSISPTKIGRVNSTSFGFQTKKVNGTVEILWEAELGKQLCERYNIPYEVDHVEFVDLPGAEQQKLLEEDPYLDEVNQAFGVTSTSSTRPTNGKELSEQRIKDEPNKQ